jgi:hypothetical protein
MTRLHAPRAMLATCLAAVGAAAVLCAASEALAQKTTTPVSPVTPPKGFDPHAKLGKAYGDSIAAMPAWTGVWIRNGPLIFDPATARDEHDGEEGTDFGVAPGGRQDIPYKPEWQAEYEKRIKNAIEKGVVIDRVGQCSPHGMPRVLATTPREIEIIVTPKITFMMWSYFAQVRRIYTDGRGHTDPDYSYPTEMGHSIGRWEGETLVIETVNMMAGNYDQTQAPYSDDIQVVERIHMRPDSQLQNDITITDPKMLAKPWKVTRLYRRVIADRKALGITSSAPGPDWPHVEQTYCTNQRNTADETGAESVDLATDPPKAQ